MRIKNEVPEIDAYLTRPVYDKECFVTRLELI